MGKQLKPACAYFRVPTRRRGEAGLGLEAQQSQAVQFAFNAGYRILAEFVEVESREGDDASMRTQLIAALDFASKQACPIIVAKLDRLSRDVRFISGLMCHKIPFIGTVRKDITDFFRGFLDVQRKYENKQMTAEIGRAVYETVKAHQGTLPQALVQNWRPNLSELARRAPEFETDQFLDRFFGAHASEEVRATFHQELKKRDLEGEVFELDPTAMHSTGPARYRTVEGVGFQVSPEARDYVKITKGADGFTTITIRTSSLIEQP
jgi:Resolvase, N terminal domain/37-kD nucleoid-associated bacterial protein